MAQKNALYLIKKGFVDKYTKKQYKNGEVAVFSRERAKEILATLGKGSLTQVTVPKGVKLVIDDEATAKARQAAEETSDGVAEETAEETECSCCKK